MSVIACLALKKIVLNTIRLKNIHSIHTTLTTVTLALCPEVERELKWVDFGPLAMEIEPVFPQLPFDSNACFLVATPSPLYLNLI